MREPFVLDAIDLALLKILVVDCRTSQRQIATMLGVSAPTVGERMARLEREKGVITGYSPPPPLQAVGVLLAGCPPAASRSARPRGSPGHAPGRGQVEPGQVPVADHLPPHRLPDAGRAVVPDVVRRGSPVLLAARLGGVVDRILGAHHDDLVAALAERVGDVRVERGMPALVAGDQLPLTQTSAR